MALAEPLKKALVTGANKGIGLAIAKMLASSGVHVLLGTRSVKNGETALASFAEGSPVEVVQLDISDDESIRKCVAYVKEKHGTINFLVNNAGIAFKGDRFDSEVVETTLATNYFATRKFTNAILPLVTERVINQSSRCGRLITIPNEETRRRFLAAKTVPEIDAIVDEFRSAVRDGTSLEGRWKPHAYGMSKVALSMWTRVMATERKDLFWAACCPGYCSTDMSSHKGPRTAAQGAYVAYGLCTQDISDKKKTPSGVFWAAHYDAKLKAAGADAGVHWKDVVTVDVIDWVDPSWDH